MAFQENKTRLNPLKFLTGGLHCTHAQMVLYTASLMRVRIRMCAKFSIPEKLIFFVSISQLYAYLTTAFVYLVDQSAFAKTLGSVLTIFAQQKHCHLSNGQNR